MLLLTSLAVLISSLSFTAAVTFDLTEVGGFPGDPDIDADFTKLNISTFNGDDETIHYLGGEFTFAKDMDESYDVHYLVRKRNEKGQYEEIPDIPDRTVTFCEFGEKFFRSYLLPLTKHPNDFPPRGDEVCPVKSGTFHFFEVENRKQLSAPSELGPGDYAVLYAFLKGDRGVGTFVTLFTATDD